MKLILSKVCVLFAVGALSLDVCATRGGKRQRKKKDAAQQQQAPACTPIPQQSVHSAPDGGGAASAREESDNAGQAGARELLPSMETVHRQLQADMHNGDDDTPVRDTFPRRGDRAERRKLIRESLKRIEYCRSKSDYLRSGLQYDRERMSRGVRKQNHKDIKEAYVKDRFFS